MFERLEAIKVRYEELTTNGGAHNLYYGQLHSHTTYSDGTFRVRELLKEAEKTGVTLLSITDHDKVDAYIEMQDFNVKDYYTGKIISGAEFSIAHESKRMELLGYGFDISKVKR